MPIIILLLLAFLIGSFGFWDTLQAMFGAVALVILVGLAAVAAVVLGVIAFLRNKSKSHRRT